MRAMHYAVENRVGERGVAQVFMPAVDRQLTGDDRRSVAIPVVEDLEQVLALRVLEPDEAPIIEDQEVDARETRQHDGVRAVAVRERELRKQAWNAAVDNRCRCRQACCPRAQARNDFPTPVGPVIKTF